jgi:hypothetical protein
MWCGCISPNSVRHSGVVDLRLLRGAFCFVAETGASMRAETRLDEFSHDQIERERRRYGWVKLGEKQRRGVGTAALTFTSAESARSLADEVRRPMP